MFPEPWNISRIVESFQMCWKLVLSSDLDTLQGSLLQISLNHANNFCYWNVPIILETFQNTFFLIYWNIEATNRYRNVSVS
jgi:hypothetical protein